MQSSAPRATRGSMQAKCWTAAGSSAYFGSWCCGQSLQDQRPLLSSTLTRILLAFALPCLPAACQRGTSSSGGVLQLCQRLQVVTAKEPTKSPEASLQGNRRCGWQTGAHLQVLQLWGGAVASLAQLGLLHLLSPRRRQATHPLPAFSP